MTKKIGIPLAVFALAFGYYVLLACKEYSWVFGGGDAGDWLAQARIWFLPQPYGSPLYILLSKAVGLLPGNLAGNMVIILSCLPAAVSVMAIYLAVLKLKASYATALVAAGIMLGAGVFLSQATIVEEYSLAVMFVSLAVLAWAYEKKWGIVLSLALASAVHIIAVFITGIWFLLDLKHKREWFRWAWIYALCGIAPYILPLYLFGHADYYWLENGLSLKSISDWLGSTGTIGALSVYDLPKRLLQFVSLILATYGLALIPAFRAAKKHILLAGIILVILWLYLCDSDVTTWTFTIYAVPFVAVLAGLGLSSRKWLIGVGASALCLIVLNGFYLNANLINAANPIGRGFYDATMSLPDGSVIVTSQGGFYTLGLFHAIADGKQIELNFISEKGSEKDTGYCGWLAWANAQGLTGSDSVEVSRNALADGRRVYRVKCYLPEVGAELYKTYIANPYYERVVSVG